MKRIGLVFINAVLYPLALYAALSETEVRKIAEQYADACIKQNYRSWQALSFNKDRVSREAFLNAVTMGYIITGDNTHCPKTISIMESDGRNVHLQIPLKGGGERRGWLQLLPDGKIKYDPLICRHPTLLAFLNARIPPRCKCSGRHNSRCTAGSEIFERLTSIGVPLFGFNPKASIRDQEQALKKINEWLVENGAQWDNSEPKVYYPSQAFQEIVRIYSQVNRR